MLNENKKRERLKREQKKNAKRRKKRKQFEKVLNIFHRNLTAEDRKAILEGKQIKRRMRHETKSKANK
ncbi:MAG: hypothetical protein Q4E99_05690 [Bacillota bacterium]|nr:hypothetical protein [Bacillota bacterium]